MFMCKGRDVRSVHVQVSGCKIDMHVQRSGCEMCVCAGMLGCEI